MKYMKLLILFFTISSFSFSNAQEVTNYDLERFAKAYSEMVNLNMKAQHEMAKIISDENLDLEVYHAINETKDNSDIEPDVPKEDFEKYERASAKIIKVQEKLEADVEKAYQKVDLTRKEYAAIAERVKQDQVLQMKLENILSKYR